MTINNKLTKTYKKLWDYLRLNGLEEIEVRFKALPDWWCLEFELLNHGSYLDACYYISRAYPKINFETIIEL